MKRSDSNKTAEPPIAQLEEHMTVIGKLIVIIGSSVRFRVGGKSFFNFYVNLLIYFSLLFLVLSVEIILIYY